MWLLWPSWHMFVRILKFWGIVGGRHSTSNSDENGVINNPGHDMIYIYILILLIIHIFISSPQSSAGHPDLDLYHLFYGPPFGSRMFLFCEAMDTVKPLKGCQMFFPCARWGKNGILVQHAC